MKNLIPILFVLITGCGFTPPAQIGSDESLSEARKGFSTKIVKSGPSYGAPDVPAGKEFELIRYESPVGNLAAYVTTDPSDGKKHPAIVWITGGDNNSIGDVWSPNPRKNDQSASGFRKAGVRNDVSVSTWRER
jgi:hypothetical protein